MADAPSTSAPVAHQGPLFKAALDFKAMKDNLELYVKNTKDRFSSADPAKVVALYDQYVKLKSDADALRAARNENANAMKVRPGYIILPYHPAPLLHGFARTAARTLGGICFSVHSAPATRMLAHHLPCGCGASMAA